MAGLGTLGVRRGRSWRSAEGGKSLFDRSLSGAGGGLGEFVGGQPGGSFGALGGRGPAEAVLAIWPVWVVWGSGGGFGLFGESKGLVREPSSWKRCHPDQPGPFSNAKQPSSRLHGISALKESGGLWIPCISLDGLYFGRCASPRAAVLRHFVRRRSTCGSIPPSLMGGREVYGVVYTS